MNSYTLAHRRMTPDLTQLSLQEWSAPQSKAEALLEKTVRIEEESEICNANR